jgi:hypothetical protein
MAFYKECRHWAEEARRRRAACIEKAAGAKEGDAVGIKKLEN